MVDFHRNTHPSRAGGEHIPAQPFWIFILRIIQAIFNVIVLGLAANAADYYYLDGYGMAIFTFIWTLLFLLYIFLTPRFFPRFYYFWGHIAFEATVWVFWLVTFALLAHYTRAWSGIGYGYRWWGGGLVDSTRAATAFAVLNWVLFSVTLGATIFLSRSATVDGTHSHTHNTTSYPEASTNSPTSGGASSFGAKFGNFFARKPRGDVEKGHTTTGGGPVNETGQPVELNDHAGAGYGNQGYTQPPPPAAAPHYGDQNQQTRY